MFQTTEEGLQELKRYNPFYKDISVAEEWLDHATSIDTELCNALFEDDMTLETPEDEFLAEDLNTHKNGKEHTSGEQNSLEAKGDQFSKEPLHPEVKLNETSEDKKGKACKQERKDNSDEILTRRISSNEDKGKRSLPDDENADTSEKDQRRDLPFNNCLHPTGGVHGTQIYSLAPGEGQIPMNLLTDNQCDVLAFPNHFPSGRFGLHNPCRTSTLSSKRYFNQRLLNVDPRFAWDSEYIYSLHNT